MKVLTHTKYKPLNIPVYGGSIIQESTINNNHVNYSLVYHDTGERVKADSINLIKTL